MNKEPTAQELDIARGRAFKALLANPDFKEVWNFMEDRIQDLDSTVLNFRSSNSTGCGIEFFLFRSQGLKELRDWFLSAIETGERMLKSQMEQAKEKERQAEPKSWMNRLSKIGR